MKLLLLLLLLLPATLSAQECAGRKFLSLTRFDRFQKQTNAAAIEWISPELDPGLDWEELILSWNIHGPATNAQWQFQVQPISSNLNAHYYHLGFWSLDPQKKRESVKNQDDPHGTVDTDLLRLKKPHRKFRIKISSDSSAAFDGLSFIGLSFFNPAAPFQEPQPTQKNETDLPIQPRSQLDHPEGAKIWCSPTSTSMILSWWAEKLHRPELLLTVPATARAINDPNWPGTGNWPFNTALAGSFEGIRAYVTRLGTIEELESFVAHGIPVAISLSYNLLKGHDISGSGHLVVVRGFSPSGELIINDPGVDLPHVRRLFPRERVARAWDYSRRTAYLIYPIGHPLPPNPCEHWESTTPSSK
ncbi:MAG: peptidase C39 family protein [Verrucomicrobiota bacterium]|nr:peptidase C39 family protein [Verrucomicrobiota bacterium]